MPVNTSQIMEDEWDLRFVCIYAQLYVAGIVGGPTVFANNMAVVVDSVFTKFFAANVALGCF